MHDGLSPLAALANADYRFSPDWLYKLYSITAAGNLVDNKGDVPSVLSTQPLGLKDTHSR